MQLTLVNFFKRSVGGNIFRGKHRLVKPVSKQSMASLHKEWEICEKNMLYLRHPYMTMKEALGLKEINTVKREQFIAKKVAERLKGTMRKHVSIGERLGILETGCKWE